MADYIKRYQTLDLRLKKIHVDHVIIKNPYIIYDISLKNIWTTFIYVQPPLKFTFIIGCSISTQHKNIPQFSTIQICLNKTHNSY